MTAPAALLLAALAAPADDVFPPPLTGLGATAPAPLVTSLLPRLTSPADPVIRGQSPPGWRRPPPSAPAMCRRTGSRMDSRSASRRRTRRPCRSGRSFAAPRYEETYGVNGPQPYDFAPEFRFDAGYLFDAPAEGRPAGLAVTELDFEYETDSPGPFGSVVTVAPAYRLRTLDGPSANVAAGQPPLPGNLHRLGTGLLADHPAVRPVERDGGVSPTINTDFEDDLTSAARQYDGRAALFYEAAPDLTLVAGAKYLDRVDDLILPWAGAVWRPGDRWEVRAVFPEPRVEYFYGPVLGKANVDLRRGAVPPRVVAVLARRAVAAGDRRGAVLGPAVHPRARKEQGWGRTFLEAGIVFDREVKFERATGRISTWARR